MRLDAPWTTTFPRAGPIAAQFPRAGPIAAQACEDGVVSQAALPSASPPSDRPKGFVLQIRRLLVALLVAVALFGVYWGFSQSTTPVRSMPEAVEALSPVPGAQTVPNQSTVTADLQFGMVGVLIIDGKEIPDDQAHYVRATGELSFTPGAGQDLVRLPGGPRLATVIYWPEQGSRDLNAHEFSWSFTVT